MQQPGEMTQVVTLKKRTMTKDRFGQHVTFPAVATVAAKVAPLKGREFLSAGAMQSPASLQVDIWYRPDIDGTWRVSWMGRDYNLVAEPIDDEGNHVYLQLMCGSVAAGS